MSDLRTRIADAIYEASDEYTRELMVNPRLPGCSDLEGDCKPVCFTLADAVIRELGLRRESMTDGISPTDDSPPWHHRYVTEWEPDE